LERWADATVSQVDDGHHTRAIFADYRDPVCLAVFLEQLSGAKTMLSVV